jgi:two-component system, chemotaxis family, chemotaxis protein CheY
MTQGFDGVLNQNLDDGDEDSGETTVPARAARQRSKECSMQSAVTNLNVLVVDDQQMMRDFITARLRELGISQVALAASATEALKQLHEEKFDLIISDWIMPDMTGLDLVKAVRGHPVLKKMPIIMASTWPGRDQMEQAKAEGVDHYLVKPFQTVQLRDSLHDIFGTVQ